MLEPRQSTEKPLIHEDGGEVSLHFNFPTIQSRMRRAEPARLLLDYTRTMTGFLLLQAKPQRIVMIVEADEGENKIVFAQKGGSFPPTFNELAERLRTLEAVHPVDLDRTAQKMLNPVKKRSSGKKRRR